MVTSPRVFVDFQNADRRGRVRLNTNGAKADLARGQVELTEGMRLELYDGEIAATGVVRLDDTEGWVAEIDWDATGP